MSTVKRRPRQRCSGCSQSCRVEPQEIQWRETSGRYPGWLWNARILCPPCRSSLKDLVLKNDRPKPQPRQLRLIDALDAPLVAAGELRLRREQPRWQQWKASPWNQLSS